MTTNDFTTAASAEAFRAWFEEPTTLDTIAELGAHMALWARDYLREQEATEDAVQAAARALNLAGWTCYQGTHEPGEYDHCEECRSVSTRMARNALEAAALAEGGDDR